MQIESSMQMAKQITRTIQFIAQRQELGLRAGSNSFE